MFLTYIRLILPILAAMALAVVLSGCGEESSSSTIATSPFGTVTQTPLPAPSPDPEQSTPAEQPSPYAAGSTSSQAVGTTIDGMRLNDIRWNDHGGFFRVVFDMGTPEGDPVLQVPHAEASVASDGKIITVILGGIRSIGSSANVTSDEVSIGDPLVLSLVRVPSMDDQAIIYEIHLANAATYSLAGLGSPGRIVIDINKG